MKMRTRVFAMILVIALALSLVGCGSSGGSSDGKVSLTFQIWDVAQKAGISAPSRISLKRWSTPR